MKGFYGGSGYQTFPHPFREVGEDSPEVLRISGKSGDDLKRREGREGHYLEPGSRSPVESEIEGDHSDFRIPDKELFEYYRIFRAAYLKPDALKAALFYLRRNIETSRLRNRKWQTSPMWTFFPKR